MGVKLRAFIESRTFETYGEENLRLCLASGSEQLKVVGSQRVAQASDLLLGADGLVPLLVVESQAAQQSQAGAARDAASVG